MRRQEGWVRGTPPVSDYGACSGGELAAGDDAGDDDVDGNVVGGKQFHHDELVAVGSVGRSHGLVSPFCR